MVVAPVRNFQVRIVQGSGQRSAPLRFVPLVDHVHAALLVREFDGLDQLVRVVAAEKDVPFRQRGKKFADVFLGQTARHDDLFQLAAAIGVAVEHRFDRLPARGIQKRAGVDDENVRFGNIVGDGKAAAAHDGKQPLGVHAVFVAPERDHSEYFIFQHSYSP